MSINKIATSAQHVGKTVFNGGATAVKWGAHQVSTVLGFLRDKAAVVMNLIMGFFKQIPQYFNSASTHLRAFAQHINNHKAYSAGTASIAVAVTLGVLAVLKHQKEAV